jgi:hypothetical protein
MLNGIKNEFVDNNKDLEDVSSFVLGGNDGKEFGVVSARWIMHFVTYFVTCFNFEICYAIFPNMFLYLSSYVMSIRQVMLSHYYIRLQNLSTSFVRLSMCFLTR